MLEQIKIYWPLNTRETAIIWVLFIVSSLTTWSIRTLRLENEYAVQVNSSTSVYIDRKMSVNELALKLHQLKLIKNTKDFVWASSLIGYKTIKQGHYKINSGHYTIQKLLPKFGLGQQDPVKVTIPPGISLERAAEVLSEQLMFSKQEFIDFVKDTTQLESIGITPESILGRLLPETYFMFWTISPKSLLQETNASIMKLIESNETTNGQKMSANEIITLASIVQWEAGNDEEKPIIAGLYLNRMKRRWRLQADPTVNFAIGERRRLLYADYQIDHPYNTYKIKGLPPGPITNPDITSIKAVLFPTQHRFMYMVATPEGVHDFSITFEEHQQKSEKWVRWLRKQYRIKAEAERKAKG